MRHGTDRKLTALVGAAFAGGRRVCRARRLTGGSKKGVYRLALDDGTTVIAYLWSPDENYWPARVRDATDPFADANGPELFHAAHARLTAAGVRVPGVLHVEPDAAVVEDLPGGSVEALLARDPAAARPVLAELGRALAAMSRDAGPRYGKVAHLDVTPQDRSVVDLVHDRAVADLAESAARMPRIAAVEVALADRLGEVRSANEPRRRYGLVHGELGPDHVLLDAAGRPVLIDIEATMSFDVEWEHAFLRLRFGDAYPPLRVDGLDPARLRLYALAQYLSLVAGPLRLLDGDFPDRAGMLRIVEANADRAIAAVTRR